MSTPSKHAKKLSLIDAHKIRRAYNIHGRLMRDIAVEYGVCVETISAIVRGKTYRDATWLREPAKVWK